MRVTADFDKCQGCGLCEAAAPEVFGLDDNGYLTVLEGEVPAGLEDAVRGAVANCPTEALSIV